MEYHAAIKKDAAIHLTQQDGHGVVKWKSYKTVCTSWSHLKNIYKSMEESGRLYT